MTKQGFDLDFLRDRRPKRDVWLGGKPYKVSIPPARQLLKLKAMGEMTETDAAEYLFSLVEDWCKGLPKKALEAVLDVMTAEELLDFMNYLATGEVPKAEDEEVIGEGELGNDQKATESAD